MENEKYLQMKNIFIGNQNQQEYKHINTMVSLLLET